MRFVVAAMEMNMRSCQTSPCARESWIDFRSALKHLSRQSDLLACPFLEQLPSTQIKFIGFNIGGGSPAQAALLALGKRETQRLNDTLCDLILDRKNVIDLPVEPV